MTKKSRPKTLSKRDYEALSLFRYQLRRFLRFSEKATRAEGITPLQYQLLVHVRGFLGREWATVGEIAERLQAQPHGVLALIARCEANGLIRRRRSQRDRRKVEIHLRSKGARCLRRLAALHRAELQSLKGAIQLAGEVPNRAGITGRGRKSE
ncbi:MAG: MarR family transcriptional regulator [Sulfurifustis sp.]